MKTKNLLYSVLMCFIINIAYAQQISPVSIGDKLPGIQFNYIYDNPTKLIKLSDYHGKAILIDFWATWCSPCVTSMPFLDSLQVRYKNDLQVICVTKENNKIVKEIMNRVFRDKKPTFLTVLKDSALERYFPHQSIPHCVWIDKNGMVKAFTDKREVTYKNIQGLITGNVLEIKNKAKGIQYDQHKPPYASKQLKLEDEFLYHSMITKYRDGLNSSVSRGIHNDFISCINAPITRLYQCAFGKFDLSYFDMNKIVLRGVDTFADSVKIGLFKSESVIQSWQNEIQLHAYSYELATRDTIFSNDQLFKIMQEDLNRFFATVGVEGHVEKMPLRVMALTQISDNISYQTDLKNQSSHYSSKSFLRIENEPISYLLTQLTSYMQANGASVVNETGYKGNISIELDGNLNDLRALNKALFKFGLEFKEKIESSDVIIITNSNRQKLIN